MIKNVVFDIGNVLLSFDPKTYLMGKIGDEQAVKEVFNAIFKSEEWLMLDRGTITEVEAIKVLGERHTVHKEHIENAFDGWYDILTPMEETIEILTSLKERGVNVYYLSNFHHLAFLHVREKYEFFKAFDGGVVSYEEKLLKPEKEVYLKLLEKYDLKGEETLFIDDTLENIKGAEVLNIKGVHFKNANDLREKLVEYSL